MPTLTVAEAAHRLGVKPNKVRAYVASHKLSARNAPPEPGHRGRARLLLDEYEVERLVEERARKKAARTITQQAGVSALELPADADGEALAGAVSTVTASDPTGQRTVALVQSMLTPLVDELHDARETIRRQAEEIGALRAAVARLEEGVPTITAERPEESVSVAIAARQPLDGRAYAETATQSEFLSDSPPLTASASSDSPAVARLGPNGHRPAAVPPPLWRRAALYLCRRTLD